MSDATLNLPPDALFVVACPVCQGHVAATGSLVERDACCPLCASLFHVPAPRVAEPHAATTDTTVAIAEDWEGVIGQLAPPRTDTERPPGPDPATTATVFEAAPVDAAPTTALGTDAAAVATPDQTVAADTRPALEPVLVEPRRIAEEPAIALVGLPADPAATAAKPVDPKEVDLPAFGGTPLSPRKDELAFREPVRTVRIGNEVIEIRRLSPEERHRRRVRRNVMMIVVGVSILLAIVVLFGMPADRR